MNILYKSLHCYCFSDSQRVHIQLVHSACSVIFLFWMCRLLTCSVTAGISKEKEWKSNERSHKKTVRVKSKLDLVAVDINLFFRWALKGRPKLWDVKTQNFTCIYNYRRIYNSFCSNWIRFKMPIEIFQQF